MIAYTVLITFYIKYIVYANLFDEKQRIKSEKSQLKLQLSNYFMSQSNGIVVLKQRCNRDDRNKLLFCNTAFPKLTGLRAENEFSFFEQTVFKTATPVRE